MVCALLLIPLVCLAVVTLLTRGITLTAPPGACTHCRYDLAGQPADTGICPECARPFNRLAKRQTPAGELLGFAFGGLLAGLCALIGLPLAWLSVGVAFGGFAAILMAIGVLVTSPLSAALVRFGGILPFTQLARLSFWLGSINLAAWPAFMLLTRLLVPSATGSGAGHALFLAVVGTLGTSAVLSVAAAIWLRYRGSAARRAPPETSFQ